MGGQRHAPATLPPGKSRYPLYRRLGGPQGRSGWAHKISPPPGFDPQTVQPVASRYTDCAIAAHMEGREEKIMAMKNVFRLFLALGAGVLVRSGWAAYC